MAKTEVAIALPIEFSEVCEVVYQDLAGTNGRSLSGVFSQAITQGGTFDATYSGSKDRLTNFRGYSYAAVLSIYETTRISNQSTSVRADPLSSTSQTFSIKYTLIAVSFANSSTNVSAGTGGPIYNLFNLNDTYTDSGTIANFYLQQILLNLSSVNDTCTVRVEIIALGIDTIPSPAFVDIDLRGPFPP